MAASDTDRLLHVELEVAVTVADLKRWLRYADRYLKDFAILDYKARAVES